MLFVIKSFINDPHFHILATCGYLSHAKCNQINELQGSKTSKPSFEQILDLNLLPPNDFYLRDQTIKKKEIKLLPRSDDQVQILYFVVLIDSSSYTLRLVPKRADGCVIAETLW